MLWEKLWLVSACKAFRDTMILSSPVAGFYYLSTSVSFFLFLPSNHIVQRGLPRLRWNHAESTQADISSVCWESFPDQLYCKSVSNPAA